MKLSLLLSSLSLAAAILLPASAQQLCQAPNFGGTPVNQLSIAGNACGPAALLAAFRFGNDNYQVVSNEIPGENDKERLGHIIRQVAMRPSKSLVGRPRWSRAGVNIADLCDMANEMGAERMLPKVTYEVLFLKAGESQEELLKRVHSRLEKSLDEGFPPLLSIRRFADRKNGWSVIDGHFVTVIGIPKKLEKGQRSFQVTYLDPWGGKRSEGQIAISDRAFLSGKPQVGQAVDPALSPCLEAVFPQALVGKSKVAKGEATVLTVSASLGRW